MAYERGRTFDNMERASRPQTFQDDRAMREARTGQRGTVFGIGGFSPTGSTARDAEIGFTAGEGTGVPGRNYAAIMDPVGTASRIASPYLGSINAGIGSIYDQAAAEFDRPMFATNTNPYNTRLSRAFGGADYSNLLSPREIANVRAANIYNAMNRAALIQEGATPEQAALERPFGIEEIMARAGRDIGQIGSPVAALGRGIMGAFGFGDRQGSPAGDAAPVAAGDAFDQPMIRGIPAIAFTNPYSNFGLSSLEDFFRRRDMGQ